MIVKKFDCFMPNDLGATDSSEFTRVIDIQNRKYYFERISFDFLEEPKSIYSEDGFFMEEPGMSVFLEKYFKKVDKEKWARLIIKDLFKNFWSKQ